MLMRGLGGGGGVREGWNGGHCVINYSGFGEVITNWCQCLAVRSKPHSEAPVYNINTWTKVWRRQQPHSPVTFSFSLLSDVSQLKQQTPSSSWVWSWTLGSSQSWAPSHGGVHQEHGGPGPVECWDISQACKDNSSPPECGGAQGAPALSAECSQ